MVGIEGEKKAEGSHSVLLKGLEQRFMKPFSQMVLKHWIEYCKA